MSRCFPFPPPNYRKEEKILTESIKLQKEQEASSSKERRKEKRRDKKEKRERSKDKKENSKDSKRAHKKRKHNEANELHTKDACQIAAAKKIELHTKGVAAEPLEKSGLTEEHGPPCLKPEPCVSSESTQTSSKGRKLETFSQQGTIIRFKLPLQKHRDPKPTEPSTSKYSEPVPTKVDEPCFSGRVAETPIEMELGESSKSHKRRRDKEGKYRDLIINWKPTPLFVGDDSVEEDLGWLLDGPRRNRTSSDAKSRNNGCEELSYGSAAWSVQPKACYLPELDMYQLPYVTPF